MKVKELIRQLTEKKIDPEREIKISQDEEGNLIKEIDGVYETDGELIIYPYG